jgi:carboxyl-terminal processing protease
MNTKIKYALVSTSTCLTLMLLAGSVVGKGADQNDTLKHIGVFSDVVAHIKSEYVEEPDMKSVTLGALNGLLESIDPFASYLNADQYKDYQKNLGVQRPGVGLILSKKFGYVEVVGTVPGSPADKAGLSTHDMIESINAVSTRDMPLAYAHLLLEGENGSTVSLSVVRVRHPEPQTIKLTRADLTIPALDFKMLPGNVGYLDVNALGAEQVKQAHDAIQKLQQDGAQKLVVDLRNCAVGDPQQGIAFANLFLNKGRITYLKGQRIPQQNFDADPAKAITTLPVAVLTNGGTADAAEIAASALGDNKRADLVGERTYGDAAMRKALNVDDGGAIILSVAKYYSPEGNKAIQDTGVTPATVVAAPGPQADIEVDENGEPISPAEPQQPAQQQKKLEDDPVLKKALDMLGTSAKV